MNRYFVGIRYWVCMNEEYNIEINIRFVENVSILWNQIIWLKYLDLY